LASRDYHKTGELTFLNTQTASSLPIIGGSSGDQSRSGRAGAGLPSGAGRNSGARDGRGSSACTALAERWGLRATKVPY